MAISIKDPETDRLARALADATGESITETIRRALEERLDRTTRAKRPGLAAAIARIQERAALLPVLDKRTADAIIGYDAKGVPR